MDNQAQLTGHIMGIYQCWGQGLIAGHASGWKDPALFRRSTVNDSWCQNNTIEDEYIFKPYR